MLKLILSTFLALNLVLFDSCDSPKTTASNKEKTKKTVDTSKTSETSSETPSNSEQATKITKSAANQATNTYNAIEIVLGRKSASSQEQAEALKLVKSTLSSKELKNNRNKRNDPNLLKDLYPKTTQLFVGNPEQAIFWTAYDRSHFAARHLIDYFDSTDIKGKNSWWPSGTTIEELDSYLQKAIETNKQNIYLPNPAKTGSDFKFFDFNLQLPDKSNIRVSVGLTSEGRVTSFFPKTGKNIITLSEIDVKNLLTAIGKR